MSVETLDTLLGKRYQSEVMRDALAASLAGVNTEDIWLTTTVYFTYRLVVCGLSNKDIAFILGKSEKTVKADITKILKRVNLNTRAQLIVAHHLDITFVGKEIKDVVHNQTTGRPSGADAGPNRQDLGGGVADGDPQPG